MNISDFWAIIAAARSARGNDRASRVDALRERLAGLISPELQSFQNHYDACISNAFRWDLRGAAFIINGGCSDAGFRHFRDWLISEGEDIYRAALADPDSLARMRRIHLAENERFGCVALELLEAAGDGESVRGALIEGPNPKGESWDANAVYDLFPKLASKYD